MGILLGAVADLNPPGVAEGLVKRILSQELASRKLARKKPKAAVPVSTSCKGVEGLIIEDARRSLLRARRKNIQSGRFISNNPCNAVVEFQYPQNTGVRLYTAVAQGVFYKRGL